MYVYARKAMEVNSPNKALYVSADVHRQVMPKTLENKHPCQVNASGFVSHFKEIPRVMM